MNASIDNVDNIDVYGEISVKELKSSKSTNSNVYYVNLYDIVSVEVKNNKVKVDDIWNNLDFDVDSSLKRRLNIYDSRIALSKKRKGNSCF